MKKLLVFSLVAAVTALAATVFAGEDKEGPKPQMFMIYRDIVKPSMTAEYEAAIKYMVSEFTAYDIDPEQVNWHTVTGPELGYAFVMPVENFAGVDTMFAAWEAAIEKVGAEKFAEVMESAAAAMDHVEAFHATHRPDLSYAPEHPALKPEDVTYLHYNFYYVIPGKKAMIEELGREYAELYKSKGAKYGWNVYEAITGADLPLFVVIHPAKSESDYQRHREELEALLGEESKAIGDKLMLAVRRVEDKDGWLRPDLSYPQHQEKKARQETR